MDFPKNKRNFIHKGVKCEQYKSGKTQRGSKNLDGENTMQVVPL